MSIKEIKNLGEPIRLEKVQISGFATRAARPGDTVPIMYKGAVTSDQPEFHKLIEGFGDLLTCQLQQAGLGVNPRKANQILLVVKQDQSALLWIDNATAMLRIMPKKSMVAGAAVFESDIADISRMAFPAVEISAADQVACLFRESWRFAFVFDFNPGRNLSLDDFENSLGACIRTLRYKHLYETIQNKQLYDQLLAAGWFPFVDLIASDYEKLAQWLDAGFDIKTIEQDIISNFKEDRVDKMLERWLVKPALKMREQLLKAAIHAYKRGDAVSVIKILMSEIEGILRHAYSERNPPTGRIDDLLKFIVSIAEGKTSPGGSLLMPAEFATFLRKNTFADFNPNLGLGNASSRHAVNHGVADPESYTEVRALQTILTIDQIAFYL